MRHGSRATGHGLRSSPHGPPGAGARFDRSTWPSGDVLRDNLSAHWTEDVRAWAEANDAELVPTPTYASWLNRIEPQFGVMVKLVIAGSDYADHEEFQRAASAFLRRRNHEARRDFADRQREKARRRERRAARRREHLTREAAPAPRAA